MRPAGHVLILTALDFEARPIARRLGLRFTSRTAATGPDITLHTIGPRARHLPPDPAPGQYTLVIMAGVAGGLSPDLNQCDVLIDDQSAPTPSVLRRGSFASTDAICPTPADKAALHRSTGALVVDMENAAARAWAARHNIPFIGIRAVSDTAAEALDPAFSRAVDPHGFLNPLRLTAEVLRRPMLVASLWRLRHSTRAVEALAREIHHLLSSIPAKTPGRG